MGDITQICGNKAAEIITRSIQVFEQAYYSYECVKEIIREHLNDFFTRRQVL